MASLISLILTYIYVRVYMMSNAYRYVFAFPDSAARTIALFEKHFCPEQSMNLSSDCRNNSDQKYLTKENDLSRKIAESGGRTSKGSTRILHKSVYSPCYYGRSITFKNLVKTGAYCLANSFRINLR